MRTRTFASLLIGWTSFATVRPALALDTTPLGGEPVHVDVTEAASVLYNADNRNSRTGSTARSLDDEWGVWYNRLNAQGSWKSWNAGLRLDSAWFYTAKDPTEVALELLAERRAASPTAPYSPDDAAFFGRKVQEASRDLATRHTDWIYPVKYYAGYNGRDVEAVVGDFYAQLGRGLVLSVRKLDELASDTTIRGARATGRVRVGPVRLRATLLGGALNPLRVDEASGRYLGVTDSTTPGLLAATEAGMPRAAASPFDSTAAPTFAPDRIVGAQLEGGTRHLQLGVQGSLLERTPALSPGVVRSADGIRTLSVSANAPVIADRGAAYVEVAFQELDYPAGIERGGQPVPDPGHAVYASLSASADPVTVTAEGKHYRRFFPLLANADIGRAPEFSTLQYSSPPTTEAFWTDTELEGFNTCVTGGRLKADVSAGKDETVFAWLGRYLTWAESVVNEDCVTSDTSLNRVWDAAAGLELTWSARKSRATGTVGSRFDDADRLLPDPRGGQTHVFYRELYLRHDLHLFLGGPFTLKMQGWNRRRHQTQGGPRDPWLELQELVAIDWAPHLSMGAGFEYTSNPQFAPTYLSGTLGYAFDEASSVSLFVGQRRGGLRCVSGVCRVYPPFEGARVDATVRF